MAKKRKTKTRPQVVRGNTKMPHVAVATICERVLKEGQTPSLVRIIDNFTIESEPATMPAGVLGFTIFVLLKSDEARGNRKVQVIGYAPSGDVVLDETRELTFDGDEMGAAMEMVTNVVVKEAGLYWFDVNVNRQRLSRIPLRIRYVQHDPAAQRARGAATR